MLEVNLYVDPFTGVEAVAWMELEPLTEAMLHLDVGERDVEDEKKSTEQRFREVLEDMHRTLAYFGIAGKMAIAPLHSGPADEDREAAQRALDSFPKEFFTITQEDTAWVIAEVMEAARQEHEGQKGLSRTMQEEGLRRGLNKEERRKLTLGEFYGLSGEEE